MQRLSNEGESLITKRVIQNFNDINKYTMELSDKILNALYGYLNCLSTEDEYAYVYIADKEEIQKFPEEIITGGQDYYMGDFVFNSECGFTKYRIHKYECRYSCELRGKNLGSIMTLKVSFNKISEEVYRDIMNRFIKTNKEVVALLELGNVIYCAYSTYSFPYIKYGSFNRDDDTCFIIRNRIPCFMPYLKQTPLKVVREIQ